jgi:hypothetical protein
MREHFDDLRFLVVVPHQRVPMMPMLPEEAKTRQHEAGKAQIGNLKYLSHRHCFRE